jgi:hypothetical protein
MGFGNMVAKAGDMPQALPALSVGIFLSDIFYEVQVHSRG